MTLSVKDASGATQTIKTNDDMAGVAGTPSANVLSVQGVAGGSVLGVSVTNLPATQAVSGAVTVSNLPATQAVTGIFFQATQPVSLGAALPAGSNLIGAVTRVPSATQDVPSRARIASAAGTNATSVKASAGAVYHIVAANMATSARFLKLYNKASAPTVGTDTPIATIYLPANGGFAEMFDIPIGFSTGIAYAITGLVADTDTTAVALNDIHGFILYA